MAKEVNVKDVEVSTEIEEVKTKDVKKILLYVLIGIVSLVGFLFWSTEVRWNAELSEHENEILYYSQDEIKIEELTGFYGEEVSTKLKSNEALLVYCDSQYGGSCITGDFNDGVENLLRNPSIVINVVILIDLVLLFILFKDKNLSKVKVYIIFALILVYGLFNLGKVVFDFTDYYAFVNDSENVVKAKLVGQLVTGNNKEYYPVINYTTEQGDFTTYVDVPFNGNAKDDISKSQEITIYYDKKDNSIVTSKQSLKQYIFPIIISLLYVVGAISYLLITKKKMK